MKKGFGLIGILIVVAIVAGIGAFVFDSLFPERSPFTPSEEEKSAIDTAEQMKDVLEGKSNETTQVSGTTEDETADWKTYRNEEYEFRYLSSWSIKDSTWPIRLVENGEDIIMLSTMDLRVAGITYCGAYPQDARCELIGAWMIDWGNSTIVTAQMNRADGMTAVLATLYKTSAKNKKDFKQFLSTFKFTK